MEAFSDNTNIVFNFIVNVKNRVLQRLGYFTRELLMFTNTDVSNVSKKVMRDVQFYFCKDDYCHIRADTVIHLHRI